MPDRSVNFRRRTINLGPVTVYVERDEGRWYGSRLVVLTVMSPRQADGIRRGRALGLTLGQAFHLGAALIAAADRKDAHA